MARFISAEALDLLDETTAFPLERAHLQSAFQQLRHRTAILYTLYFILYTFGSCATARLLAAIL